MNEELKVYIVIRKDLKMRRGKEIAQACHAMQYLCEEGQEFSRWVLWNSQGHAKITVSVDSENELASYSQAADSFNSKRSRRIICNSIVIDEGRTEIPKDTITCIAIGPITNTEADELGLSALPLR